MIAFICRCTVYSLAVFVAGLVLTANFLCSRFSGFLQVGCLVLVIAMLAFGDSLFARPRISTLAFINRKHSRWIPTNELRSIAIISLFVVYMLEPWQSRPAGSLIGLERRNPDFISQMRYEDNEPRSNSDQRPYLIAPKSAEIVANDILIHKYGNHVEIRGVKVSQTLSMVVNGQSVQWQLPPDRVPIYARPDCRQRVEQSGFDFASTTLDGIDVSHGIEIESRRPEAVTSIRLSLDYGAYLVNNAIVGRQPSLASEVKLQFPLRSRNVNDIFLWIPSDEFHSPFAALKYSAQGDSCCLSWEIADNASQIEPLDLLAETRMRFIPRKLFDEEAFHWQSQKYASPDLVVVGGQNTWMSSNQKGNWFSSFDIPRYSEQESAHGLFLRPLFAIVLLVFSIPKIYLAIRACEF